MKKLNVNLKHLANYLVQLFYKTGQKYTCTQTKIGKLLSILAFSYARENLLLFEESILKSNCCGTAIDELKVIIPERDIYLKSSYCDGAYLIDEPFNDKLFDPSTDESLKTYVDISTLSDDLKKSVDEIFRTFGAMSPQAIGELINPIVNFDGISNFDGSVNLDKIVTLTKDSFSQTNTLIDYLFSN